MYDLKKGALAFVFSLFLAFGALVSGAHAETNIGILDLQLLLSEAKAAKNIQEQVNAQREKFVQDLAAEEEILRAQEKAIIDEAQGLSQDELAKKRGEFERSFQEARAKAQTGKARIERALVKAMEQLRGEISSVVDEILEQDGYDIVLPKQNLIAGGDDMDISKKTLERLNAKVTEINLEIES